jgi:transcriptional regulator with PAS, ATPase and Fis domain
MTMRRDISADRVGAPPVIGSSSSFQQIVAMATRVAATPAKVLITGESGVGKDVIARWIHTHSPRTDERFVAVNCAGVSETLLESELFGHVKGSFTGAYRDKVGRLEQADRGTIFLDEIGDMSLRMQALLLRFLETGEIVPVGSDRSPRFPNVRIISATNRDLQQRVDAGELRYDLFCRINVVHLHVPPLRERVEDIRPLLTFFLAKSRTSLVFSEAALQTLERYSWPGNVRELQNTVEQLASLAPDHNIIEPDDLPPAMRASPLRTCAPVERRQSMADGLYEGLIAGHYRFWDDVYALFMQRDITRADVRTLIRRGLETSSGSYRRLLRLFGIEQTDYKRLLNFLAAHDCRVNSRDFQATALDRRPRSGAAAGGARTIS